MLSLFGVALVACGSDAPRNTVIAGMTGDATKGATVWGAQCKSCHGDDGKGKDLPGSNIATGHAKDHSDASNIKVILDGLGTKMPGFGDKLNNQEVADLMAHLHKLQGK